MDAVDAMLARDIFDVDATRRRTRISFCAWAVTKTAVYMDPYFPRGGDYAAAKDYLSVHPHGPLVSRVGCGDLKQAEQWLERAFATYVAETLVRGAP